MRSHHLLQAHFVRLTSLRPSDALRAVCGAAHRAYSPSAASRPALLNRRVVPPGGPADRSMCPDDHFNVWERFAFETWDAHENPDGTPFVYNARAVELVYEHS